MTENARTNGERRAVVGVFTDTARLQAAADELCRQGFAAEALGLLAPARAALEGVGSGNVEHVGQGPDGEPLMMSGSAVPAGVAAAAAAPEAGGLLSAVGRDLEPPAGQLPAHGLLLWVLVESADEDLKAARVLEDAGAERLHRHNPTARSAGDDPLSGFEPDPLLPGATV